MKERMAIVVPEYIERSNAAAHFENSKKVMWHKDDVVAAISSSAIPTADVAEVRHGEWEDGYAKDANGNIVYRSIDCSECGEYFKIKDHDVEYWKGRFKMCPFCGAVMDGKGE